MEEPRAGGVEVGDGELGEVREEVRYELQGARTSQHVVRSLQVHSPDLDQPAQNTVRGDNFKLELSNN